MNNYTCLINDQYRYMHDSNQVINTQLYDRFIRYGQNRKIDIREADIDETLMKERLQTLPQLIFEATENCNLRCKYCVYNGSYINQRSISPKPISFETAKKGLELVYGFIKNRKNKEFHISFYGGEPLMNFKVVKEVIEYAKKLFQGWELYFNLTTNLTLLNDTILDYLVQNKVSMMVSLDGDKENHDAKRVLANGNGTHDTVMKNLAKIAEKDPEYFRNMINISAVHSFDLPLENLYRFFTQNNLIKKLNVRFSGVNTYNTDYYDKYPYKEEEFRRDLKDVFMKLLEKLRAGEELSGYESFFISELKGMKNKLKGRRFDTLGGTCLFDSRLYLDAEGKFHICEKMNNTFSFGDVEKGFDLTKMAAIARDFREVIKTHCIHCNIRYLCTRCFVTFAGDGKFQIDPSFCEHQKQAVVRNLERYILCKEENLI